MKACIKVVGTLLLKAAFTFVVPIFVLDSFVLSLVRTHYFLTLAFFSVLLLLFFFKLYLFARSVVIWGINNEWMNEWTVNAKQSNNCSVWSTWLRFPVPSCLDFVAQKLLPCLWHYLANKLFLHTAAAV